VRRSRFAVVAVGVLVAAMWTAPGCNERPAAEGNASAATGSPGGAKPTSIAATQPTTQFAVKPAPPDCPACAMGLTAEFVFGRLDTDKDGKVTVKEFGESPGIHGETEAREALGRIDTDGSGALSWAELEAAYKLRHAHCKKVATTTAPAQPGERGNMTRFAQVFIMRSDKNGDGKLDKSEFRGGAARFDQMDKNANGFLEPEELKELHERRMADPKSMRERLESGDVRRPPPSVRPGGMSRTQPATAPAAPSGK